MTINHEINPDLLLSNYDYELPPEQIADRPVEGRHHSRLLVYKQKTGEIIHDYFYHLDRYLPPSTLLIMNNSKVYPCRLIGEKLSGGQVELFILSLKRDESEAYSCLIKTARKKKLGDRYRFGQLCAEIVKIQDDGTFRVKFLGPVEELEHEILAAAKIPIPPYIRGGVSDERDLVDYQTVYAQKLGSVAAPTAGLHFTPEMFQKLEAVGIKKAFVTLHVGLGTFSPVKTESILEHQMHSEEFSVDEENWGKLQSHRGAKIAVGTTALRCLESSLGESGNFEKASGETKIFLYPGKEVKSIDGLITNFHLPKSSLLMLVSALIGREKTLQLYREAVQKGYRFFSYGDAMLILRHD